MEYNFTEKSIEEMEARKAELLTAIDADGADIDAIDAEARAIKAEIEARKAAEAKKAEIRKAVAEGVGTVVKTIEEEKKPVKTNDEIRASKEYAEAYKNYIIKNDDSECRALLSENASGVVPVPVIVDATVRTAWENNAILSRVNRTSFRGNFKAYFELSADGAYEHTEGTSAPTEESLTLGIVTMIPKNVKKWITISDEAVAMGGEEFLSYVYRELTYRIIKKLADLCIADVTSASTSNSSTAIGVPKVSGAPSVTVIPEAAAYLSDEAESVVVVMNRLSEVEFLEAHAAGNFAVDPFAGLTKIYTSALPAYSTASDNAVYAIVGDLRGAQVNYPEGEGVVIKWDDLSESEKDLVKVVGRQYAAHAVTAPFRFTNIAKPAGT